MFKGVSPSYLTAVWDCVFSGGKGKLVLSDSLRPSVIADSIITWLHVSTPVAVSQTR
jgi:hypothetical protein